MNLFKKVLILAISGTLLNACVSYDNNLDKLKAYNKEFKKDGINVYLKSFSDHRQGKALLLPNSNKVIYAYKPQILTNGQMLPLLGYYLYQSLDFKNNNAEQSVGIDISLRNVDTSVRHGAFPASRLGYYNVEVRARVILRDMVNNEIIDTFPILASAKKVRTTTTGRSPSSQEDQYAMLKLVDEVSITIAKQALSKAEDVLDYYYNVENLDKAFSISIMPENDENFKENFVGKADDVEIEEIDENALGTTPEMLEFIESEEQKLLERKEQQRQLFEKKLEDQKYLEFMDSQQ